MRFVVGLFVVTVTGPGPHPRLRGLGFRGLGFRVEGFRV